MPTDQATRSAWVEKIKGLKFIKMSSELDPVSKEAGTYETNEHVGYTEIFRYRRILPGIFPDDSQETFTAEIISGHRRVEQIERETVAWWNNLVCQWQALIPELEKKNDAPTVFIQPIGSTAGKTITVASHGIVDLDGIKDVQYLLYKGNISSVSGAPYLQNTTGIFPNLDNGEYTIQTKAMAKDGVTDQFVERTNPHLLKQKVNFQQGSASPIGDYTYYVTSIYDDDYHPYKRQTSPASMNRNVVADGKKDAPIDFKGYIP